MSIALLGLGAMGLRMGQRLLDAGLPLTVWNRNPERAKTLVNSGALLASSPRAAVQDADFALCMTRDDVASRFIWLDSEQGALANLQPDCIALDCSTLSPNWVRELGEQFDLRQRAFLEAPVAGSLRQVESGQLIFFLGGNEALVARVEPLLKQLGSAMYHTGAVGTAAVVKLTTNTMLATQAASLAELLGLAPKIGLDGAKLLEIFGATPVASAAIKFAGAGMLAQNYAANFPLALLGKDLRYLQDAAAAVGAEMPMLERVNSVIEHAISQGLQFQNFTVLAGRYK